MKFSLIIALLTALSALGCSYRDLKTGEQNSTALPSAGASVGFSQIQAAVLAPKCARCHAWAPSYEAVKSLSLEIQGRITSTDANIQMPPTNAVPLTAEEKALLLSWIAAGSPREPNAQPNPSNPNNPTPPNTPPAPPAPPGPAPRLSFANVNAQVFQPKCARCHSGMMSSYERVTANLQQIEMRVRSNLDFEKMPPSRAPQLTDDERNLLLDWIQAGAPKDGLADGNPPENPTPPSPPAPPSPLPPCNDLVGKNGDDDHCQDDFTHQ